MAASRQGIRYIRLMTVVSAMGLAGPVLAQADDPIARAKLLRTVADQKAADDVAAAVKDADALARTSAAKAIERLKQAQLALDVVVGISSEKRKELTEKLQARITGTGGKPTASVEAKADTRKALEAAATESREVADGLSKASAYHDRGQVDDARRVIAGLLAKYPNHPSLLFVNQRDGTAAQLRAEKELARQAAEAWTENMRDIARSAVPATGDIQFPSRAKWQEITKLRQQPAVKLTPKEEKIIESLNKSIGALFKDRPFEEALQELSNMIEQPIFIDKKSLEDLGLDLTRRVTFQGNVSARTALRAILQGNGLTFVVKDEMIQVLTLEKAQQTLVTRSYYLGDLVSGNGPFGNAVQWGPFASYQQTMQNAQMIVDAVTSSIDPMAWNTGKSNGPCTISFHLPTMSVIVRASAEVHASLGNSLSGKK